MILIKLPCTLADLETAIHKYGDHHGFDVIVDGRYLPASFILEVKDEKGKTGKDEEVLPTLLGEVPQGQGRPVRQSEGGASMTVDELMI